MKRKHFQVFWYQTWRSIFIHQRARARTHTHTHAAYAVTRWARERESVCVWERERERPSDFFYFRSTPLALLLSTSLLNFPIKDKRQVTLWALVHSAPIPTPMAEAAAPGVSVEETYSQSKRDLFYAKKRAFIRKKETCSTPKRHLFLHAWPTLRHLARRILCCWMPFVSFDGTYCSS